MHGFPSFLLVGGGAQIGISVFDIILVIMLGFPSFLLVRGGAKIGISVFDIICVIMHGFPSFFFSEIINKYRYWLGSVRELIFNYRYRLAPWGN